MRRKNGAARESLKLFFKSAVLTAIALTIVAIGFIAARYFFGG